MNPDEMDLQEKLHLFKGPALSILGALFGLGRPAGVQELCEYCDYGHQAVERGLKLLANRGLVQRHGYHNAWMLTALGRQLPLFGAPLAENQQVGGGSGLIDVKELSTSLITTTTTGPLADNQQLDITHCRAGVQALISLGGVSPANAEAAARLALEHGIAPDEILRRVQACAAYISKKGSNLKFPGAWAAGLIGAGYEPPLPAAEAESDETKALSRYDGYLSQISALDEREKAIDAEWIKQKGRARPRAQ